MNWQEHITSDKNILIGKPIIKGTRISVELILELLESGWSEAQILESYPGVTPENLKAVYAYLREGLKTEMYFTISKSA